MRGRGAEQAPRPRGKPGARRAPKTHKNVQRVQLGRPAHQRRGGRAAQQKKGGGGVAGGGGGRESGARGGEHGGQKRNEGANESVRNF